MKPPNSNGRAVSGWLFGPVACARQLHRRATNVGAFEGGVKSTLIRSFADRRECRAVSPADADDTRRRRIDENNSDRALLRKRPLISSESRSA
jgi:hypothetical protein